MRRHIWIAAFAAICLSPILAMAQDAPPTPVVDLSFTADMKTLQDPSDKSLRDSFTVSTSDAKIKTVFTLLCQGGSKGTFGMGRKDEACAVTGTGTALLKKGPKERTQYSGGFTVKKTGDTDMSTIVVDYTKIGGVAADHKTFGGNIMLKPENPSGSALDFGKNLVGLMKEKAIGSGDTGVIDERVDTVELGSFQTPSAGWPEDEGCSWRGTWGFAYQTEKWFIKSTADCKGKTYELVGNLSWIPDAKDKNMAVYNLNLSLPSSGKSANDALMDETINDASMEDVSPGISGSIAMKLSGRNTIKVEGVDTEVFAKIEGNGKLVGEEIPLDVVRSFSTLFTVLSRSLLGA